MADNEIIKALECCLAKENCEVISCEKCPLENQYECRDTMFHQTLDLINRQQAEIERLEAQHREMCIGMKVLKKKAIEKFAERLCNGRVSNDPVVIAVKVELERMKEMTEVEEC